MATPYSSATPFAPGPKPTWLASDDDVARVQAYEVFESIYWNQGEYAITANGQEPIHIPAPKAVIEAVNRFLAVGWDVVVQAVDANTALTARLAFKRLIARENLKAKFNSQKRFGLIRGDAGFYITADATKEQGSRISIHELDPANTFPILQDDNPDRVIGYHIIQQVTFDGKAAIQRQTYRRELDGDNVPTGVITSEEAIFDPAGWDDRYLEPDKIKRLVQLTDVFPLPSPITQLPVYWWKNLHDPDDEFGSSILRGMERLAQAVDQTVTDEDLAVALAGLGVYATDSTTGDSDADGEKVWILGPGRVVEVSAGASFTRVSGVTSVQPSQDHVNLLRGAIQEGAGVPDLALGNVDVQTAESGIALSLKLSPLLAGNAEREVELLGVTDQFLYDLQTMWFPAYEQVDFGLNILVVSSTKDPMPTNRDTVIAEIIQLVTSTPPLITLEMAITKLEELGYEYPENAAQQLIALAGQVASATDPFAQRVQDELTDSGEDTSGDAQP